MIKENLLATDILGKHIVCQIKTDICMERKLYLTFRRA